VSDSKVVASAVGMVADQAAKNIAQRLGADLITVTTAISAEINRVEGQLSVLLSNVEGHYQSEVANLKLKLVTQKFMLPLLIGALITGVLIGLGLGRTV